MYSQLTENEFIAEFIKIRPKQFTIDGLSALYKYIEDYEEDTGEKYILDVIELCTQYVEYSCWEEFAKDFPDIKSIYELEKRTDVIYTKGNKTNQMNGGFIVRM